MTDTSCTADRITVCANSFLPVRLLDKDGAVIAQATYLIGVDQTLNPKSLTRTVRVTATRFLIDPNFPASELIFTAKSGQTTTVAISPGTFQAQGSMEVPAPLGNSTFSMTATLLVPDAEPITTPAYNDPNTLRCDNNPGLKRYYEQGCINPAVTPVLTTMSGLPYIANNIRNAFWNLRPSTLTRNKGATGANRQAACSAARMKALPPADPAIVDKSCDEYPFAGTSEGGANAIIAWVPLAEQNSQGGLLQSFYSDNRVFDGDKFQVTLP
ncbi:NucA/NucB deoxyribonuclease domain-containing protein [Williamsia sp. CHRR-6]|uniref:NucA/NucB deoxyribonuclease domain-containing protein n=1 Tax=Williamsia sp. CHRR-6 TaxID=2835871 RepID=UPI001BD9C41D|nr:NucA/NucB deoxyribonuclease domain-containing protein [Williamsia sp. CHRR-6]MBT0567139.1 hypothetical protein [Williamsia sp. CHRR-6]